MSLLASELDASPPSLPTQDEEGGRREEGEGREIFNILCVTGCLPPGTYLPEVIFGGDAACATLRGTRGAKDAKTSK